MENAANRAAALIASDDPLEQLNGMGILLEESPDFSAHLNRLRELSSSDVPAMFGMTVGDVASMCLVRYGIIDIDELDPFARSAFDAYLIDKRNSKAA